MSFMEFLTDTEYEIIWNEGKSKELPAPCILILLAWYW